MRDPYHGPLVADSVGAGILEPFAGKVVLIEGVLSCLSQLLRLDLMVASRRSLNTKLKNIRHKKRADGSSDDESSDGRDSDSDSCDSQS